MTVVIEGAVQSPTVNPERTAMTVVFEATVKIPPSSQRKVYGENSTVIPAKGVAGVSCSMLHARETVLACKPVRALQGGIQRLS